MPASQHQNPKSDIEISQAAKMLGVSRVTLYRMMEKYGIR